MAQPTQLLAQGPDATWKDVLDQPLELPHGVVWIDQDQRYCGRQLSLPDRLRVDFETTWLPQRRVLIGLRLFDETHQQREIPASYWTVYLNTDYVQFGAQQPVSGKGAVNQRVNSSALANFEARGQALVTILADRPKGQIEVYLDGHPVAQWQAPKGLIPTGDRVLFVSTPNSQIALRQIRISPWTEPLPKPAQPLGPPPKLSAPDGQLRVILHNGDRLSLNQPRWEEQRLSGQSPLLGPISLPNAAVRLLDWVREDPTTRR